MDLNDVATGCQSDFPNMKKESGARKGNPWGRLVGLRITRWKAGVCQSFGASTGPLRPQQPPTGVRTDTVPLCLDIKDRGKVDREGPPPLHRGEDGRTGDQDQ